MVKWFLLSVFFVSIGYFISSFLNETPAELPGIEKKPAFQTAIAFPVPGELVFAGEKIVLEDLDLVERYDRELLSNVYFHSNTILLIKRSSRWFPQMKPILDQYNIPEDFLYLPLVESGLTNSVSPAAAVGFWQLTKGSATELGLEISPDVDERYDPLKSTEAACRFLVIAKQKFGTWTNAAASYNRGMFGLSESMEKQKMDSYYDLLLNEETSRYLFRIFAIKEIVREPEKYGYSVDEKYLYYPEQTREVIISESVDDWAKFALKEGINYKLLKRYNPWLRSNKLLITEPGKRYVIRIPLHHREITESEMAGADSLMIGEDRYQSENGY